jgi:iron(III) transport system permease protein
VALTTDAIVDFEAEGQARGRRALTQERVALPVLTLLTAVLVLGPLLVLVRTSLTPADSFPLDTWAVTLENFVAAYGSPATLRIALNTIWYAAGTVLLALALACAIAWLTERTDLPGRTAIRVLMFATMTVPPLALAFGWILLLNPNNGAINVLVRGLLGLEDSPFDVYSLEMMIFVSAIGLVPTMFVMLCGVFRNMDPQLESAATVLGVGRLQALRRITLPLLSPGILSVVIYMLMIMVQAFETPLAIGLTAKVPVLSTRIYLLTQPEARAPAYGLAAAFGIGLLVLAGLLLWGYFRATRVGERFRVVTGKGFRPRRLALGRWRLVALAGVGLFFMLKLAPLLLLLWTSLLPFYRVPSLELLGNLSLANYASVLGRSATQRAVLNTIVLMFTSATLTMLLASLISWFAVRGKGRTARCLDVLAFAPLAIPGIVMALAILLLYIRTPLYSTIWIIVLAHVTIFLAFGTRAMNGALLQIHPELEHAAMASGAPWSTALRKILLPLLWPHFLNGWLWVVAHSMRDLTMPLMLMSTSSLVVSSAIWQLWGVGQVPAASALIVLMTLGLLALVLPVQLHAARSSRTDN